MSRTYSGTTFAALLPGGLSTLNQGADQFAPFSSERLFTAEEAAAYLRVEPRTLCKFITGQRDHKLSASWIGRRWIIKESALLAFIKAQEQDTREIE
jgi:excisionase family DNA binding protein